MHFIAILLIKLHEVFIAIKKKLNSMKFQCCFFYVFLSSQQPNRDWRFFKFPTHTVIDRIFNQVPNHFYDVPVYYVKYDVTVVFHDVPNFCCLRCSHSYDVTVYDVLSYDVNRLYLRFGLRAWSYITFMNLTAPITWRSCLHK